MDDLTADELRRHYDGADTAPDLERAELDTTVVTEPMVGITIRLSAATLDAARILADEQGLRVTALLRTWIEERVTLQKTRRGPGGPSGSTVPWMPSNGATTSCTTYGRHSRAIASSVTD